MNQWFQRTLNTYCSVISDQLHLLLQGNLMFTIKFFIQHISRYYLELSDKAVKKFSVAFGFNDMLMKSDVNES